MKQTRDERAEQSRVQQGWIGYKNEWIDQEEQDIVDGFGDC